MEFHPLAVTVPGQQPQLPPAAEFQLWSLPPSFSTHFAAEHEKLQLLVSAPASSHEFFPSGRWQLKSKYPRQRDNNGF